MIAELRGTAHDRGPHEYEITDRGMRIMGPLRGVERVLGGSVHRGAIAAEPSGGAT